jgi:hypothetical protein
MIEYKFIGWCKEGAHDKVWGVILLHEDTRPYHFLNKYLTFWGRRGAKLQTKIVEDSSINIREMFRKKLKKGYQQVDKNELDKVYPEFEDDLEKTAVMAILKN